MTNGHYRRIPPRMVPVGVTRFMGCVSDFRLKSFREDRRDMRERCFLIFASLVSVGTIYQVRERAHSDRQE